MGFADVGGYELDPLAGDAHETPLRRYSSQVEDLFWSTQYWKEHYFRADYDYEDYAPAYCVGYSGCAQYGGTFEEAEKSLCANYLRIKGDSRLTWEEAIHPIRAAWVRVGSTATHGLDWKLNRAVEQAVKARCAVPG